MIVFDIETDALKLEDITKIHCICFYDTECKWDESTFRIENDETEIKDVLSNINDEIICGHNILEFDIPVIQKFYPWFKPKKVIDTLVLSRLIEPDRKGRKLEQYAQQLGFTKVQNAEWSDVSENIIERCKSDVEITTALFKYLAQKAGLFPDEMLGKKYIRTEHEFAKILNIQKTKGWKFDKEKALKLNQTLADDFKRTDEQLQQYLKPVCKKVAVVNKPFKKNGCIAEITKKYLPVYSTADSNINALCYKNEEGVLPRYLSSANISGPFSVIQYVPTNLGSEKQLKKLLFSVGWEPIEWNMKNGERTSPKLTEESYDSLPGELGQLLARRNKIQSRLTLLNGAKDSTDKGLLANVRPDGRISADGIPCATPTGRTIHRTVVNIPKASKLYGREIRELFTCADDRLLMGCDASGIQWRCAAHYIRHPETIQLVESGDIHDFINDIAGLNNRELAKGLGFLILFGGGVPRISIVTGRNEKEAKKIFNNIINKLPGLKDFIERVRLACKKGYLIGLDGRKLFFRKVYSAPNLLIQSAEAIIMKNASIIIFDEIEKNNWDAFQVGMFHDEFIFDCENKIAKVLTPAAIDAIKLAGVQLGLRCKLDAKAKTGKNWYEIH